MEQILVLFTKIYLYIQILYVGTLNYLNNLITLKVSVLLARFTALFIILLFFKTISKNPLNIVENTLYYNFISINYFDNFYNSFLPDWKSLYDLVVCSLDTTISTDLLSQHREWCYSKETLLLLFLLVDNFFSQKDFLLILSELNAMDSLLYSEFFYEFKIQNNFIKHRHPGYAANEQYFKIFQNELLQSSSNFLKNVSPLLNTKFPLDSIGEEDAFNVFFESLIREANKQLTSDIVHGILIKNCLEEIDVEFLKFFFFSQILLLNLAVVFLKKKVLVFFIINIFIFCLMAWNLIRLCTAINLIYSLLHFLFFAVLSGMLIIFWGATYIGFCVLLIYGAAIPVLALYIIMLVNVDLIQRLFFVEHLSNKKFFSNFWKILLFGTILSFLLFSLFNFENLSLSITNSNTLNMLNSTIFYLLLAKRYFKTLDISYSTESIYDLSLSFHNSDIDKVASAAYKISYNELLALVFLLLIAIIVVISISWSPSKTDTDFYEISNIDTDLFEKFYDYWRKIIFAQTSKAFQISKFLHKKNTKNFYANYLNSEEFFTYWGFLSTDLVETPNGTPLELLYFVEFPTENWYDSYDYHRLNYFLKNNSIYQNCLPYGTQNSHPDDYFFRVSHYGLLN